MQVEVILAISVFIVYSIAIWALGWRFGARSFRDKNKRFLDLMKKHNDSRNPTGPWYRGYNDGMAETLAALERFLGSFKERE